MPAIPESTRSSILLRLLDHAERNWPQLAKVQARYHGSFAYVTGVLPGGEQIPLFRLRYGGSAHSFGFAIYSPARDRYEDAVLLTGLPIGSPQEALDTACTFHLAALGYQPESWPPTDLRCYPLSERLINGRFGRGIGSSTTSHQCGSLKGRSNTLSIGRSETGFHIVDLSSYKRQRIGSAAAKCSNQADLHLTFTD